MNNSQLAKVIKVADGIWECSGLSQAAGYIVEQSMRVSEEKRSVLLKGNKILAVTGQTDISKTSDLRQTACELVKLAEKNKNEQGLYFTHYEKTSWVVCLINCPKSKVDLFWILEYEESDLDKLQQQCQPTLLFLKMFYSRALVNVTFKKINLRQLLKPLLTAPLLILALFIFSCVFVKVPEKAVAPFSVVPSKSSSVRAKINGLINFVVAEGTQVKSGDLLISLDTKDLNFQLRETQQSLLELDTKLSRAEKESLIDSSKNSEKNILAIQKNLVILKSKKILWQLKCSSVYAQCSGVVRYPHTIKNINGAAVQQGDIIFDIEETAFTKTEIHLNEKDYGILAQKPSVSLYLHADPVTENKAKITKVNYEAEMTRDNQLSFKVESSAPMFARLGETGYAHFYGKKVALGKYLFKHVIVYIRGY
ncbi:MAG: biotin/lipoyl-binding protein [Lentisphaeraceae bacterium]|nr:biotin/lipoyl-binding protein [Lentisphaeraceae bacterium]